VRQEVATEIRTGLRLGTAGWNVPAACRSLVGGNGSHLERYATAMNAVEIDTSFYRPHRRATYERWALATPDDFRFSVKAPKAMTHVSEFDPATVDRFAAEVAGLGPKLAVLLVQLPPKATFRRSFAEKLFDGLRSRVPVSLVCEPRHASWFLEEADRWLADSKIARVAADPPRAEGGDRSGGWQGLSYFRLHGSPRVYYSSYGDGELADIERRLTASLAQSAAWCIFDNTASGAALENALRLKTWGAGTSRTTS
jgi:uncharacterized protein YecE (DUF72 family)